MVAEAARRGKEEAYPELLAARRCALVVVALETGGRWSANCRDLVRDLAETKAREVPEVLRGSQSQA